MRTRLPACALAHRQALTRGTAATHRANLSDLYFTNRQDRYAVISSAPQLAGYFSRLVGAVGDISYAWTGGRLVTPAIGLDPVRRPSAYKAAARYVSAGPRKHTRTPATHSPLGTGWTL